MHSSISSGTRILCLAVFQSAMFCKYFIDRKFLLRQFSVSLCGLLHGMCAGCVLGFTSILLPQLQEDSHVKLTEDQESWIASVTTLVMFPATLFAGWALEKIGRKRIALTSCLLNLSGWISLYFAINYEILLLSRILSGLFAGMGYPIFITYIGEVVDPRYRAFFLSFLPLGCNLGVFACHLLGAFLPWPTLALMTCAIPIYNLTMMSCYMSESYVWYKNLDDIETAQRCFTWFRGTDVRAMEEFTKAIEINDAKSNLPPSDRSTLSILTQRSFLIPFGVSSLAFATNQFSGNMALLFYTSQIISIITPDPQTQFYSTTGINILRILATITSSILVKVISVKRVLTVGGCALALCLLNLSVFLYLSTLDSNTRDYTIVCLASVIASVICFALSLGPLPSIICGELFPAETRGIGSALSSCCSFAFLFIVVKLMPGMLSVLTPPGTFLIFAVFTLTGIILLAFVLPDSKNKTLKEIGDMYHQNC